VKGGREVRQKGIRDTRESVRCDRRINDVLNSWTWECVARLIEPLYEREEMSTRPSASKRSIIFVTHTQYPHPEGLSFRIAGLHKYLESRGFDIFVVAAQFGKRMPPPFGMHEPKIIQASCEMLQGLWFSKSRVLYRIVFTVVFSMAVLRRLAEIRSLMPSVIVAEQQLSAVPTLLLSTLLRTPCLIDDVLDWRTDAESERFAGSIVGGIYRLLATRFDAMIFSSHETARKYPAHQIRGVLVPNGVETIAPNLSKPKTLIFLSSYYSDENRRALRRAVEIFLELSKEHDDIMMTIVGGPPNLIEHSTWNRIRSSAHIRVMGFIDENLKQRLLRDSLVTVMPYFGPNVRGGSRIKALEALASGIILISTRQGVESIPGLRAGSHYLLANSIPEFVETLRSVLMNPTAFSSMTARALELSKRFSWEVAAEPIVAFLQAFATDTQSHR
jgi:glycosyltransferase involved in cell wall biosynthesis